MKQNKQLVNPVRKRVYSFSNGVKQRLSDYNLKPLKRLGQNFLINQSQINKIIKAAGLTKQDIVLEIGPGLGGLTLPIAKEAKQVIAVEKDKGLANTLTATINQQGIQNIKLITGDILSENYKLQTLNYKLISNLPYNIAVAVVMQFLEAKNPPEQMVVLLQKEVGQRMVSNPPKMEKLAVFCQFYAQVKILDYINKESFWPKPKVDSALMQFIPRPLPKINRSLFAKIVNAGFANPRKTLLNNLSKGLDLSKTQITTWLLQNKINPSQRPQTLAVPDWLHLTQTLPHSTTLHSGA